MSIFSYQGWYIIDIQYILIYITYIVNIVLLTRVHHSHDCSMESGIQIWIYLKFGIEAPNSSVQGSRTCVPIYITWWFQLLRRCVWTIHGLIMWVYYKNMSVTKLDRHIKNYSMHGKNYGLDRNIRIIDLLLWKVNDRWMAPIQRPALAIIAIFKDCCPLASRSCDNGFIR